MSQTLDEWVDVAELLAERPPTAPTAPLKEDLPSHPIAPTLPPDDAAVHLTLRSHKPRLDFSAPAITLGVASIRVASSEALRARRLDIVCVIDRSGSMAGRRLDLVVNAVRFMSESLRATDRIAVVSYASDATIDLPLTPMDAAGRAAAAAALGALHAGGQTDLSQGLLLALGECVASDAPAAAVLLFTDGAIRPRGLTFRHMASYCS